MRFRPCIDLHQGQVKQIVGSSLSDQQALRPISSLSRTPHTLRISTSATVYLAATSSCWGPVTSKPQQRRCKPIHRDCSWGGIHAANAAKWLEAGACQLIATSYVFKNGQLEHDNLRRLVEATGRERLVLDLSCARIDGRYVVMTDRWQQATDFEVSRPNLEALADSCCEFLIHATDVEGKQQGIDVDLVALLGEITPLPTTYAGGVRAQSDIDHIAQLVRAN